MRSGDFSGLASNYSNARPDYSSEILRAVLGLLSAPIGDADLVDVGAGTGIWTRMLAAARPRSIRAVEPNDEMRSQGVRDSQSFAQAIQWSEGSGEATGLETSSADLVTMASSFHWVDFDKGTKEFARVLRTGGLFCALWNPRDVESTPLLFEIESYLHQLRPDLVRRSSGRSGITEGLTRRLEESPYFGSVIQLESSHVIPMSVDRYVTAWKSVNDVQVQLGDEKFELFLDYVREKLTSVESIEARYTTRAWVARVVK